MIKNKQLIQTLCLPYCIYYKPGKNEESVCRGAVVVDRLVCAGKSVAVVLPAGKSRTVPDEFLVRHLCGVCDFHEHDCDFMQDQSATPCGGYLLLEKLLDSGMLAPEDVR